MHSSFSICYLSLSSSPSRTHTHTHTQMLVMQSGGMLVSCSGWFLCRTCPVGSWLAGLLRLTQIHTLILNGYTNTHTHTDNCILAHKYGRDTLRHKEMHRDTYTGSKRQIWAPTVHPHKQLGSRKQTIQACWWILTVLAVCCSCIKHNQ